MEVNRIPEEYLPTPFTQIITLADGQVIKGRGALNSTTNDLWLWPTDQMSFAAVVTVFSDPTKTSHIRVDYSAYEYIEVDGYTKLSGILEQPDGMLEIRLNKGAE